MLLFFEEYQDSPFFNVYDTDDCTLENVEDALIFELYRKHPRLFPQLAGGINDVSDIWHCAYNSVSEVPNGKMYTVNNGVYTAKSNKFSLKWSRSQSKIAILYQGVKVILSASKNDGCLCVNDKNTGVVTDTCNLDMRTFGIEKDGSLRLDLGDNGDIWVSNGNVRVSDGEFEKTVKA